MQIATLILDIAYAALLVFGGIFGYARARSTPSLLAGVAAAALMAVAAFLLAHYPRASLGLATAVSFLLGIFFVLRYARTRKAMPAIPMIVVSDIVALWSVVRLLGAPRP